MKRSTSQSTKRSTSKTQKKTQFRKLPEQKKHQQIAKWARAILPARAPKKTPDKHKKNTQFRKLPEQKSTRKSQKKHQQIATGAPKIAPAFAISLPSGQAINSKWEPGLATKNDRSARIRPEAGHCQDPLRNPPRPFPTAIRRRTGSNL